MIKLIFLVVLLAAIAGLIYAAVSLIIRLKQPSNPETNYLARRSAVWFAASVLLTILAAMGYRWAAERNKRLKSAGRG